MSDTTPPDHFEIEVTADLAAWVAEVKLRPGASPLLDMLRRTGPLGFRYRYEDSATPWLAGEAPNAPV